MTGKDAYIEHLENTIKDLQNQVSNLTEMILLLRKEKYGPSSEKTPKNDPIEGQLSLFNEAELKADASAVEPIEKDVEGYKRKAGKTTREELIKDLPVREIPCTLPGEEQYCDQCGTKLKVLGTQVVREELEYIPAKLRVLRYVQTVYECPECKHTEHPFIVKAPTPTSLMNHSLASPSSVANVMYQKYMNSVPLYRQEKDWEQLGIALSRATMANWIIRCAEDYLRPIVDHLRRELLKRDIIHCDETPVQVLKEEGKKPQTKSYMWLYRTGNDGKTPIILYDYQPSRNGDHAVTFLKDFKGYVHSDGYPGYNKLADITRCGCWAHLRRKFVEAVPGRKAQDAPLTNAEIGRDYCDQLFHIEDSLKKLTPGERFCKRLELEKPILEAFWSWLGSLTVLKGSSLGKAVTYAQNQKSYMENYLPDGRCSISNNAAENAIRPFTVGRKNWLFADTPKGASSSAAVYSIVETAKANGLNVYTYLEYLLLYMPDTQWQSDPSLLDDLMPWAFDVQEECSH
ncbi:MAG TPA: IS66 family transposase [Clostridiales bacterium]|nr:IS66 family transposase [Clostridiales bacterium]